MLNSLMQALVRTCSINKKRDYLNIVSWLKPTNLPLERGFSKMTPDIEVNRIVWIDLEMTGLNLDHDEIIEIACVITDTNLNIVAEAPNLIINTPEAKLQQMDEWCINQHGKTGLTEAVRKSDITSEQAEDIILGFIKEHVAEKMSPLAGNSVYMDRMFIQKYMPSLHNYLHYRIIDVSTVKELCRRWNKDLYKHVPDKEYSHRALTDIKESIKELQFYKANFFKT